MSADRLIISEEERYKVIVEGNERITISASGITTGMSFAEAAALFIVKAPDDATDNVVQPTAAIPALILKQKSGPADYLFKMQDSSGIDRIRFLVDNGNTAAPTITYIGGYHSQLHNANPAQWGGWLQGIDISAPTGGYRDMVTIARVNLDNTVSDDLYSRWRDGVLPTTHSFGITPAPTTHRLTLIAGGSAEPALGTLRLSVVPAQTGHLLDFMSFGGDYTMSYFDTNGLLAFRPDAGRNILSSRQGSPADTFDRVTISESGLVSLGTGSAAADVSYGRSGTMTMTISGKLIVAPAAAGGITIQPSVAGDGTFNVKSYDSGGSYFVTALNGGSNSTNIGTNNTTDLNVQTNSVTRLNITSAGNVTFSPPSSFTVGAALAFDTNNLRAAFFGAFSGSGNMTIFLANTNSAPSTNPTGGISIYSNTGVLSWRDPSGNIFSMTKQASTTDLRTALINLGLYTSGGASPLNLNGGAFTAAAGTFTGLLSATGTSVTFQPSGGSSGILNVKSTDNGGSVSITATQGGSNTTTIYTTTTSDLALGANNAACILMTSAGLISLTPSASASAFAVNTMFTLDNNSLRASFFGAFSGSGNMAIFIANSNSVPASNPTGGGLLYVESGALKWRGSSGTITTIAPA